MTIELLEEFKNKGKKAFTEGRFQEAIEHYTGAIQLDPGNFILYSNRSAAEASLNLWESALQDANKVVELQPEWSKGYGRVGAAYVGLGDYEEAVNAYKKGLEFEPVNVQLQQGLKVAENNLAKQRSGPMSNPFNDPNLFAKLQADPKVSTYFAQPDYLMKIAEIQKDPKKLAQHLSDPRIMQSLGAMLGVNIESPAEPPKPAEADTKETKTPEKVEEPIVEEETPKVNDEALKEKELGNAAYKNREFDTALKHYENAFNLDPTNAAYLANKSAVLFEQGNFEECIKVCEEAVKIGRENHAEFKLIGRLLGRIGSSYERLGDIDQAINYYGKSVTEARNPEIYEKMRAAEKLKIQREKEAYRNPALAEEERNLGNDAFKAGDYATAVKHYTEAIKRDEQDPRAYSNRAACYLKLAAIQEGLKDAEKCLEIDPTFVKGYLRKAALQFVKREYKASIATCEEGMNHDSDGKHRNEFQNQISRCFAAQVPAANPNMSDEERAKAAMQDPEVQEILADPAMRVILSQMQSDPKAAAEHLRNPMVAAKIAKLAQAGIVRTH